MTGHALFGNPPLFFFWGYIGYGYGGLLFISRSGEGAFRGTTPACAGARNPPMPRGYGAASIFPLISGHLVSPGRSAGGTYVRGGIGHDPCEGGLGGIDFSSRAADGSR